jgi:hypothetical protein
MPKQIHIPTEEENKAAIQEFVAEQRALRLQRMELARLAHPALARLVQVCAVQTGQSYHVRALLYSLWNGQPASLSDVLHLDNSIRLDVCAVLAAFGFESSPNAEVKSFFYDAFKDAFKAAGLFDWFVEAHKPVK